MKIRNLLPILINSGLMADTLSRGHLSSRSTEEQDIRVEDYLNDKLQTNTDLESLDTLLENVKQQQLVLKQQVYMKFFGIICMLANGK